MAKAAKKANAETEVAENMAIVISDTPKLTAGKVLFKMFKDRLIGVDGTKDEPKLTQKAVRQYCNNELKRLYHDRRNLIFNVRINDVDARLQRAQWLKILSGWADPETDLITFPDLMFVQIDADMSDEPARKTVVTLHVVTA